MFHIIFLLLGATQYGSVQAHYDSLYIYNAYTASDKIFEQSTLPEQWIPVTDSVTHITSEAFLRLQKYNNKTYEPVDELNREAIGVALVFPQPSDIVPETKTEAEPTAYADGAYNPPNGDSKVIAFKVLDDVTHFMAAPNGKGKIPYVIMNYFAKGRVLVKSERLNPITLQPIPTVSSGPETSSN